MQSSPRSLDRLFQVSFVILFLELTCIRWFASTVIFLSFFTNLVLMACFLGATVGCLTVSSRRDYLRWTLPLLLGAVAAAAGLEWAYHHFWQVAIDVGGQRSPEVVYFGTEYRAKDPSKFLIPVEAIAGFFFVLIAAVFLGLGQTLGRAFVATPNRVTAYTVDLLGALSGIGAFAAASYFQMPPPFWFLVAGGACVSLMRPHVFWPALTLIVLVPFVSSVSDSGAERQTFWSPYYRIQYDAKAANIDVNGMAHQTMQDITKFQGAYIVPHHLNQAVGQPPFKDMLVIGAGSGNDVAMALAQGVEHIDAVEIDAAISRIGMADHPNHPFDDPRVTRYFDDGRSFLRHSDKQYDAVVYALVDSLVLHSGYSSLRLESFLFTQEAFRDVKARLKPGGVFVMYNYYRQGWIVARLAKMAEEVFGDKPIVISLPYQAKIAPGDSEADHFTVIMVGNRAERKIVAMRDAMIADGSRPQANEAYLGAAEVSTAGVDLLPSDNWPFLYLKQAVIPFKPSVTGMALIAGLSLAFLFTFAPVRQLRPNGQMFFLGAGFMLLETRGVVQMALLFGSTWIVNSFVFAAVLVMALASNLTVLAFQPRRMWPFYLALGFALAVNLLVPLEQFLAFGNVLRAPVSCAFVFVPMYFAGIIFAAAFRDSRQPDVDFGSNVGGIILGGLSEYFSLIVGFKYLLLIAGGYYLLSYLLKTSPAGEARFGGCARH